MRIIFKLGILLGMSLGLSGQVLNAKAPDSEPLDPGLAPPGQNYYYTEKGEGQPLLLLHAFPTDKRMWAAQLEGLSEHFRVIALDLEGFGEATDWVRCYPCASPMPELADRVFDFMQHLKIEAATVAGISMGGYVALELLARHPEAITKLVLSNTQAIADTPEQKLKREKTSEDIFFSDAKRQHFVASFLENALHADAPAETKNLLSEIAYSQHIFTMSAGLRGMAIRKDHTQLLRESELPILVIGSADDKVIPLARSEEMAELAKNASLVVIKNSAHLSNIDQAETWNEAVLSFALASPR